MAIDYPLVTVRIPAYNHSKYIEESLDSVLEDPYPNKEIVIINDGSTDNTDEIINSWISKNKNKIFVRYRSRENRGLCRTLNELIEISTGKYLVSLASDDYLIPGGIEKRVNYLESHPDKYAVFGDAKVIDIDNNVLYESGLAGLYKADLNKYYDDTLLKYQVISNWAVPGPVLMVKKEMYSIIGMYNTKLFVEDWDMYLRMVSRNFLGFIPDKVSAYRIHESNQSMGNGVKCKMYMQMLKTIAYNFFRFDIKSQFKLLMVFKLNIAALIKNAVLLRCMK